MENQQIENVLDATSLKKKKWVIFLILSVVFILIVCLGVFGYACWSVFVPINKKAVSSQEFLINKGEGVKKIAGELKKDKIIRSAFWFETYVWYKNLRSSLKAGKYSLNQSLNIPKIVITLSGGKVIDNSVQITFPEGFTMVQIKARLIENGVNSAQELNNEIINGYQVQYKFLGGPAPGTILEGFLFPDTYRFDKDIKKDAILKRFLDNFDKKLTPDLREEISRQGKTIYQIIILASIVQQEAIDEAEMPMISGVFNNRLKIDMPLQSDATVNYITGKKMRQALTEDTKIISLYNTYLNKGLPPTPICNPGLAAIKAAIYPQASDYLYFLHPLNSSAIFSKTTEEHNKNRAKYLK